jgi:hypothetical protein
MTKASTTPRVPDAAPETPRAFDHPDVRLYFVAALASLILVCGVLFSRDCDIGAAIILAFGAAGLFLRWTAAPALIIMLSTFFILFPNGMLDLRYRSSHFRPEDWLQVDVLILSMAMLTFVSCQFVLFGLRSQALPYEPGVPNGKDSLRRPATAIGKTEIAKHLVTAVVFVVLGCVGWFLLSQLPAAFGSDLFFVGVWTEMTAEVHVSPAYFRFVLLFGGILVFTIAARLVILYWQRRSLTRDAARMFLQDVAWNENRREYSRIESRRAAWQKAAKSTRNDVRS